MVPDLHAPIGRASDENVRVEAIPNHLVNGHVVCLVGLQKLAAVGLATFVDMAFLCANQEKMVSMMVKVKGRSTAWGQRAEVRSCVG